MSSLYLLLPFAFFFAVAYFVIRGQSKGAVSGNADSLPLRYAIAPAAAALLTLLAGLFSLAIFTDYQTNSIMQGSSIQTIEQKPFRSLPENAGASEMSAVDWAANH